MHTFAMSMSSFLTTPCSIDIQNCPLNENREHEYLAKTVCEDTENSCFPAAFAEKEIQVRVAVKGCISAFLNE